MKRVNYNNEMPKTFEEHLDYFNFEIPYTVFVKKFPTGDIVPLHYGKTIEILVCDNLIGEVTIENTCFALSGKQVFIIPPDTVHSNNIKTCDGTMYVLKVEFEAMANYINLPMMLEYNHKTIAQLSYTCPECEKLYLLILSLIKEDDDIFACLSIIIIIFKTLQNYTCSYSTEKSVIRTLRNSDLRDLITWTEENYNKKILIEEVSKLMGYSKYYFCNRFKAMTGATYMNYLNSVRISHACNLLRQNYSITDICFLCGFQNVSYFIQIFKKFKGLTPKMFKLVM